MFKYFQQHCAKMCTLLHIYLSAEEAGVVLENFIKRLGHSDDDTLRNNYLHITEKIKKRLLISLVN
jgi:hypothetical protein